MALSRLVLSRETILRHAHATLQAPELLEIPGQASALGLWTAVLERARAESLVDALVQGVLEENPGAAGLRSALGEWSRSEVTAFSRLTAPALDSTAPPQSPRPPVEGARTAHRFSMIAIAGVLVATLISLAVFARSHLALPSTDATRRLVESASALSPATESTPLGRAFRARVLARCWRDFVATGGAQPATLVDIELFPSVHGNVENVRFHSLLGPSYAGFRRCVVNTGTLMRFAAEWSGPTERFQLILPSAP